jgi:beta-lactamase superfamily II metal-dependent hydrolase
MELHFLPYGRVDAILIGDRSRWVFVDGGFRRDGIKAVKYMRGLGIEKLDAYIATHRHRNHVGAAPVIIREMKPGVVYTRDARMRRHLPHRNDKITTDTNRKGEIKWANSMRQHSPDSWKNGQLRKTDTSWAQEGKTLKNGA